MRNFLQRLSYRYQQFMQGRYGMDALTKPLIILSFVCLLLANLPFLGFFRLAGMAVLIWTYFRICSKNIGARRKELYWYHNQLTKWKPKWNLWKKMWKERHTKRYFKCKKCGAMLSVPKGKGKIEITCRVCHEKMIRKS